MSEPTTLGEAVDQRGYAQVMVLVGELAHVVGRIPCGEWEYRFTSDPRWRVCLNGGAQATWTPPEAPAIPRFHAYLEFNGWPAALVNPAEGTLINIDEASVIAALETEIDAQR